MRSLIFYVLAALLAGWLVWSLIASPRIELAQDRLASAQEKIKAAEQLDENRLAVIQAQAGQLSNMLQAETKNRELLAQLASQSRAHTAALQELKRNDATITEYLRSPVPAALGRLYQRPETADPSRYRAAKAVSADTVHASGAPSTTSK